MKTKKRKPPVWRYRLKDVDTGEIETGEIGAVAALRQMAAGLEKLAAVKQARELDDPQPGTEKPRSEVLKQRAQLYRAEAERIESLPKRAQLTALRRFGQNGADATAETFAQPVLDGLIRGVLQRGEKTRDYTGMWARRFNLSDDAVRNRIKRIKKTSATRTQKNSR